ncbi:MAG: glycoside hydrolase family 127 protein [Candidatus Aminicenantes bacterium]|nr:glycoside hydrolase family 127 protein [Candidatus Aminicenantes bacterium]
MKSLLKLAVFFAFFIQIITAQPIKKQKDYPIKPIPFTEVSINDAFWSIRTETNRKVTIPFAFKKCEETGRINNFLKAAGKMEGKFEGLRYNDSDVFKIMEGASYSLRLHPDPKLEKYLDDLIVIIAAAQEDDGYLYTARTIDPENPAPGAGDTRWSKLRGSHELYNVGHMYEAAVAHYLATGKRTFLDVAIRNADLLVETFGPDKKHDMPGHQETEIGLVKLYRVTGNSKYLNLARFFLNERGKAHDGEFYPESSRFALYNRTKHIQDHKPVLEQEEAVGHAVRAAYMYAGMADVAALTGNVNYVSAINRIWENVVSKKLYLTGGIGSRHDGEAFGDNYELPNLTAYNETCAAIGNVMWNHRLFLLFGETKYLDVLERTLYNGLISGMSLSGDLFFYPNPLESDGEFKFNQGSLRRKPWFDCACCPGNLARFLPSIPGYIYANKGNILYVNLFVSSSAKIKMANNKVTIKQESNYPWEGDINITVDPERSEKFAIYVRIPGWAQSKPVPSDLYRYKIKSEEKVSLKVNGNSVNLNMDKGFAKILRNWKKGDKIELDLPMPIKRVLCNEKVEGNRGKVAIERGPIVYCAEEVDNGKNVRKLVIPDNVVLRSEYQKDLVGGIVIIHGIIPGLNLSKEGKSEAKNKQKFIAIPYYAWGYRGEGQMAVWLAHIKH